MLGRRLSGVLFVGSGLLGSLLIQVAAGGCAAQPAPRVAGEAPSESPSADEETTSQPPALADLVARANEAYQRQDYEAYVRWNEQALELRPGHPRLLYNLACGQALGGHRAEALATLERLAALGLFYDIGADDDLASLREEPTFAALEERFAAAREPLTASQEAFGVAVGLDFIPEGLTYDLASRAFFLSGVRRGEIARYGPEGASNLFALSDLGSILGLEVDTYRGILWAVASSLPQYRGSRVAGRPNNALLAFDLETGARRGLFPPPQGFDGGSFNDLAVAADGTVFVGDARSGALLRLPPGGDALEILVAPGTLVSPNGLAISADGSKLYVADYARGLALLDLASGELSWVKAPDDNCLLGIDGLDRWGVDLVAIQNGVRPARILRLELFDGGRELFRAVVLERNHPAWDEPTLGVMVGDDFYYIANSHWPRFDRDGNLPPLEELQAPSIRLLRMEPAL